MEIKYLVIRRQSVSYCLALHYTLVDPSLPLAMDELLSWDMPNDDLLKSLSSTVHIVRACMYPLELLCSDLLSKSGR